MPPNDYSDDEINTVEITLLVLKNKHYFFFSDKKKKKNVYISNQKHEIGTFKSTHLKSLRNKNQQ